MRSTAAFVAKGIPDLARQAASTAVGAVVGTEQAASTFSKVTDQLQTMTPAQLQQFRADLHQGKEQISKDFPAFAPLIRGSAALGNDILGAAATGAEMIKSGITGEAQMSEAAKSMTLRERGAFFASATAQAASSGADTFNSYMAANGNHLAHVVEQAGIQRYGLTPAQAKVFSSDYAWTSGYAQDAKAQIRQQYANDGTDGKFGDAMIDRLSTAGRYGDNAGSYVIPVQQINAADRANRDAGE